MIRTPKWGSISKGISGGSKDVDHDEFFDDIPKSGTPLGRARSGKDMAYTVLFLCSSYTNEVTGQAWNLCGGSVMSSVSMKEK